ncbi:MAG TPA: hypothetical protein VL523_04065 [Terriglobia bacterium]|nr:hypothetical protein [Terriglobia bacterium]
MNEMISWPWATLFLLGAYHGINPGMGWLFAVALGMQQKSPRAVWRALVPISAGHALAIGVVVALAGLVQAVLPLRSLKIGVAVILLALGFYHLLRHRHPRFGGMRVGFGDLAIWSFLMASAHGAGLMVLPVLFGMHGGDSSAGSTVSMHHVHMAAMGGSANLSAVLIHTLGYLMVTGFVAWVVYEKLGLALLRKAWLNLDLIWAVALIATGILTVAV